MGDVHARRGLDALHRKVRGRADAGRGVGELLFPRERDQFRQIVCLHGRVHRDDIGRAGSEYHRREVLQRIVARTGVQAGVHRVGDADHEHRVAVGRGALDELGADVAARAGLVLHHHRLSQRLAELLGHEAPDDVGRAPRAEGDDELYGMLLRPFLSEGRTGERGERRKNENLLLDPRDLHSRSSSGRGRFAPREQ